MKRRNIVILIMVALVIGLMGSCDALFENQFKAAGLGQPTADQIEEQTQSDDPAVAQPALAIQIEAGLETNGAAPIVDNLVTVMLENTGMLENLDNAGMQALVEQLVPEGTLNEAGGLAAALDAILASQVGLASLAASIDANGQAVEGINAETLAITAVVATVLQNLEPAVGYETVGQAVEALYTEIAAGNTPDVALYIGLPVGDLGTILTADPTVTTLFGLAGLDLSLFM